MVRVVAVTALLLCMNAFALSGCAATGLRKPAERPPGLRSSGRISFVTNRGFAIFPAPFLARRWWKPIAALIDEMWDHWYAYWSEKNEHLKLGIELLDDTPGKVINIPQKDNLGNTEEGAKLWAYTLIPSKVVFVAWRSDRPNPLDALYHEWCHVFIVGMQDNHEDNRLWRLWKELEKRQGGPMPRIK